MSCLHRVPGKRLKVFLLLLMVTAGVLYFEKSGQIDIHHLADTFFFLDYKNYSIQAEKWILIDVTDTSRDIQYVDVPGWRILVLGDSSRNKIKCSNCVHFNKNSPARVSKLFTTKPEVTQLKMEALLYAIYKGAEWIFWSNDVSSLKEEVNRFKMAPRRTGLIYRNGNVMHASRHFSYHGEESEKQPSLYQLWNWSSPAIQKVWHPELFRSFPNKGIDYRAPSVLITKGTFLTEPLTGSLFQRSSFWGLAPLFTKSVDKVYVWSFWIQRLLWEYNGTIELFPPLRNSTYINSEYSVDKDGVSSKIQTLTVLRNKLSGWNCNTESHFYTCVTNLAKMMVEWKYFTKNEMSIITEWVALLNTTQPIRNGVIHKGSDVSNVSGHRIVYTPRRSIFSNINETQTTQNRFLIENPFASICNRHQSNRLSDIDSVPPPIDDILLIIIFNYDYFGNIHFLNYMYGRYFSHIVICGSNLSTFMQYEFTQSSLSFIEVHMHKGYNGYQCMMEAMQMGYDVKGYFQISDDVLVNVWNIAKLPRNRIWFQKSMRVAALTKRTVPDISINKDWWPWRSRVGRATLIKVWKDFSVILKDQNVAPKIQKFLKTLEENSGKPNRVFYEASDIYYIPASLKEDYIFLSSWFLKNNVFLEIAIPTVINGLVSQKEIVRLPGTYLWFGDRLKFKERYNANDCFLHTFKLNIQLKRKHDAKFICERYLPQIDRHLKELHLKKLV